MASPNQRPSIGQDESILIAAFEGWNDAGSSASAALDHLAKVWGIRKVCVLEKGYIGGGNTARNTAVIRSNYITPQSVRFYKEAVELYGTMSRDLGYNTLFSQRGQLTLAHSDATVRTHVSNILSKLHLASRTQAALYALREGLASLDDADA